MTRKSLVLGTAAGAALGLVGTVGVGTASAATKLSYNCVYPLIGDRGLDVDIEVNLPSKIGSGQSTGTVQTRWTANLGADTTEGLRAVDAASIEGHAISKAVVASPDSANVQVNIASALQKTSIPDSGSFSIQGFGTAPALKFTKTGKVTATLGDFDLKISLLKADGSPSALGTFASKCTPKSGQDLKVVDMDVVSGDQTLPTPWERPPWFPGTQRSDVPGTLNYGFNLAGSSKIKAPNGTVPLKGGIDVRVDGVSGAIEGELALDKTSGPMSILGFLPVTADVRFEQVGKTVGSYANGEIKTKSTMWIYLPRMAVFGAIPLHAQANCRANAPSVIDMHSTPGQFFNPKLGGKLIADNYSIAPLENCGALNGILSIFTQGSGNTIDLNLTPKA
ncbi:DUF6801 domain-containing protein [Thermomonospora umbrina]|uniref:DUF6801 domain-containing protein n=1 Tax=Thermomonospora umbrina TaxID=111806 RepID=UPI0011C1C1F5|nr:DUF6801 domain-containing protein [Thermomonospora umbrina]